MYTVVVCMVIIKTLFYHLGQVFTNLHNSLQLRMINKVSIQSLQVWQMVNNMCGIVTQQCHWRWSIHGVTQRELMKLW